MGIDPGFRATGMAFVEDIGGEPVLLGWDLVRTEATDRKILVSHDDWACLAEVTRALEDGIRKHRPRALVVETPAGSKSLKAAKSMAYAYALCAAICEARGLPVVLMSAGDVKKRLTGRRAASKKEVAKAVSQRRGLASLSAELEAEIPGSHRDHVYDAAALCIAAWDKPVVRAVRSLAA